MNPPSKPKWIICQIGAREHYALPRALNHRLQLAQLITDIWIPPGSLMRRLPGPAGKRLAGRYAPELADAVVRHFSTTFTRHEAKRFLCSTADAWSHTIARNDLFQRVAVDDLRSTGALRPTGDMRPVVFAYAYAARKIFEEAKKNGARTVLGQIDGGLGDERYIRRVVDAHAAIAGPLQFPPQEYWNSWQEECKLADTIVVNSRWSHDLLLKVGIEGHKIREVPVIYEPEGKAPKIERHVPSQFSMQRPLRVLFLGTLSVRKGVLEAVQAARLLAGEPVEFWFIGNDPQGLKAHAHEQGNVRWLPAVPRRSVGEWYQKADVFLFPSHSDGFGMTQLEAHYFGLPVIASAQCGRVVEDGKNGLILTEVSAEAIATVIRGLVKDPNWVRSLTQAAERPDVRFTKDAIVQRLLESAQ